MLHQTTLKKQELKLRQEQVGVSGERDSPQGAKTKGIYSKFSDEKLATINSIKLNGPSYSTKIDTLIKHLLWLRVEDSGAKSIIFTQFHEFLEVLAQALNDYGIGYRWFNSSDGVAKFKEDPGVECLLMDGRAHASGMNLVNASHVFLCEPVLNTALELQAIARVDRIGQEHETTVWLYLVDGTVEESIYNLSVQRRLEQLDQSVEGKGKATASSVDVSELNIEAANSMELQRASLPKLMEKNRSLGEAIQSSDLWACLFGQASKANPATSVNGDDRFNDPVVMRYLAGEAAMQRNVEEAGPSTQEG
jgi:E3 ubiquitin-protein ligase SHPRH